MSWYTWIFSKTAEEHVELDDEVLLSTEHIPLRSVGTRQLLMNWMGPFRVVRKGNDVAYQLELPKAWRIHNVFHVSLLKPYHKNGRYQPPPPALLVEGEEEFEVEEILSGGELRGQSGCAKKLFAAVAAVPWHWHITRKCLYQLAEEANALHMQPAEPCCCKSRDS